MSVESQVPADPAVGTSTHNRLPDEQFPVESSPTPDTASFDGEENEIENLPPKTWVTLGLFAVFVIAFGTCASTYLFR